MSDCIAKGLVKGSTLTPFAKLNGDRRACSESCQTLPSWTYTAI